jgi:ligand-binding SRPBCC domain-containing protein
MATTHLFERRTLIDVPASEAFAWHLRAGAFERLLPPGDGTRVAERQGRIEDDTMRVVLSVPVLAGIRQRWTIRHEGYVPNHRFVDVMERGPFKSWRHEHRIDPIDEGSCELVDHIEFVLPAGPAGSIVGAPIVRRRLDPMFDHRHAVTVEDLLAHREAALSPLLVQLDGIWPEPLGLQLAAFLSTGGHDVAGDVSIVGATVEARHAIPDVTVTWTGERAVMVVAAAGEPVVVDTNDDPVTTPRIILRSIVRAVAVV